MLITSRKQFRPSTDGQPPPFPIVRGVLPPNSFHGPRFTKLLCLRLLNIANRPYTFKTRFNAPAANYSSKHIWHKSFINFINVGYMLHTK